MWWNKSDDELEKLKKEKEKARAKEEKVDDLWNDTGFPGATDAEDYEKNTYEFSSTDNFEKGFELQESEEGMKADTNSSSSSDNRSGGSGASVLPESEMKALAEKGFDMDKMTDMFSQFSSSDESTPEENN